jgi:hypothetical protein
VASEYSAEHKKGAKSKPWKAKHGTGDSDENFEEQTHDEGKGDRYKKKQKHNQERYNPAKAHVNHRSAEETHRRDRNHRQVHRQRSISLVCCCRGLSRVQKLVEYGKRV